MLGAILNAAGILIGGLIGLWRPTSLSPAREQFIQVLLGVFTVFYGLRLTVMSFQTPFTHILKQLGIVILSLMLGRLIGGLLRLQKLSNRIGQQAREAFTQYHQKPGPPDLGFKMCAALYCAAPLGIVGAVTDGLSGYFYPLLIKGIMDGLATMGLVRSFRWGPVLAAIPVLAFQATITVLTRQAKAAWLPQGEPLDALTAVAGFLIFAVALVILQIKRLKLADYLPALLIAPLFGRLFG